MKEVLLKSDIEELLRNEKKYLDEAWLPSEDYRAGALETLNKLYQQLCFKKLDLKK